MLWRDTNAKVHVRFQHKCSDLSYPRPFYLDVVHYVDAEVGVGVLCGLDAGLELLHHVLLVRLGHEQDLHLRPGIGSEGDEGDDSGGDVAQHPAPKVRLVAPPRGLLSCGAGTAAAAALVGIM